MLKTSFFSFIILCALSSKSQVDYNEFLERYPLTCTKSDSASIIQAQLLLDSLGQFEIVKGKKMFLHHIAMTYYMRYAAWYKTEDRLKSLKYNQQGFDEFQGSTFAWSLAFAYNSDGNCEQAIKYADIYSKLRKEEGIPVDQEQLDYIYSCKN